MLADIEKLLNGDFGDFHNAGTVAFFRGWKMSKSDTFEEFLEAYDCNYLDCYTKEAFMSMALYEKPDHNFYNEVEHLGKELGDRFELWKWDQRINSPRGFHRFCYNDDYRKFVASLDPKTNCETNKQISNRFKELYGKSYEGFKAWKGEKGLLAFQRESKYYSDEDYLFFWSELKHEASTTPA